MSGFDVKKFATITGNIKVAILFLFVCDIPTLFSSFSNGCELKEYEYQLRENRKTQNSYE